MRVYVEGYNTEVEFPDDTKPEVIKKVLSENFPSKDMPKVDPLDLKARQERDRQEFEKRDYLSKQKEYFARVPEALGTGLKMAPAVIAEGALGFMKMIEGNSPSGLSRKITQSVTGTVEPQTKDVLDYAIEDLHDYTRALEPHYERGTPEYYAHAAILSLGQNVIPITVGTLTGGSALPLFMMGAQSAGSKYNDLLDNGMESGKASVVAGMYGAAEAIGEKVSIGKLIKGSPLSRIILGTLYDIPGELLTEVLQAGIDGGILGEDDAFNLDRFIDTAIITGISTPFLGGGSALLSRNKGKGKGGIPLVAQDIIETAPEQATKATPKQESVTEVKPVEVPVEAPQETVEVVEETALGEIESEMDGKDVAPRSEGYLSAMRVSDLETTSSYIQDELTKAIRDYKLGFREGAKVGTAEENTRLKRLAELRKNYNAFVGEARAIKKWLRERATDFVKSKGMSPEFRDAIQGVINFDSSALKSLITANPEDIFIDEEQIELLDRTTEQDLSLDELRNVKSIIKQIRHQGVIAKQAEVKGEKILRSVLIDDVNNEILEDWGLKDAMDEEQARNYLSRSHEKLTKSNRVMSILSKVKSAVTKAETVFDILGSKKLRDATIEEIARSERVKLKVTKATDERLSKAFSLIKEDIENDWNKIKAFGNVNISTRMALAVALNSQREVNRRSLRSVLTDQQIDSIVDALSPNQTAFVEQIWKTLEYQQPMVSDAYRRLTGERLKLDEGRYYPNMPDVSESDILSQKKADQDLLQDFGSVTSVARGFTKKAQGANVPPILDPLRIIGHIDSVNHFIAYGNSVRSVNRIINDTAFKKTASFVMNDEIPNTLNGWLKSVANPRTDRDIDGLKWLRNNVTMSMLGVKLSTSILQFTAIFQALPRIGVANFARYSPEFFANPLKTSRMMYEKSVFLADRRGKLDVSLAEMVGNKMDDVGRKMGLSKRAVKRMREVGMFPIQITDAMATLPVWWTAYNTKLAESGNEVEAVEHADRIVRQTASSTSTKDLAKVQKGAWKNVFMFYSYASTTLNEQLKDNAEFRKAWRRGDIGTGLRDWTYGTFMRYMAPALIIGTLKGLATGGDDEDAEESVTKGVANEIIQNVFGGLGPLYGVYQGVMSERPTGMKVSATQGVVEDIRNLKQGFFSDKIWEGRGLAPQWRGLIGVGGAFLGLPAKQTTLLLDEAIDAQENGEISTKNITGLVWANRRKKD